MRRKIWKITVLVLLNLSCQGVDGLKTELSHNNTVRLYFEQDHVPFSTKLFLLVVPWALLSNLDICAQHNSKHTRWSLIEKVPGLLEGTVWFPVLLSALEERQLCSEGLKYLSWQGLWFLCSSERSTSSGWIIISSLDPRQRSDQASSSGLVWRSQTLSLGLNFLKQTSPHRTYILSKVQALPLIPCLMYVFAFLNIERT